MPVISGQNFLWGNNMRSILVLTLGLVATAGCIGSIATGLPGNGVIQTVSRDVPEFQKIEVRGAFDVEVKTGPHGPVQIKGDENLLELVKTEVTDGRLVVSLAAGQSIRPTQMIHVGVSCPMLDSAEVHGASRMKVESTEAETFAAKSVGASQLTVESLKTKDLKLVSTGASSVTLAGTATHANADVTGASKANLGGLAAEEAEVEVAGASQATVQATKRVAGSATGASQVHVVGKPDRVEVKTSGASSVSTAKP